MRKEIFIWLIVIAVAVAGFIIGRLTGPEPSAFASVDVHCSGGNTFRISTGNNRGTCTVNKDPRGSVSDANCNDDRGNGASVECRAGGSCNQSKGAGSCLIK